MNNKFINKFNFFSKKKRKNNKHQNNIENLLNERLKKKNPLKINEEKITNFKKRKVTINNITFELGENMNKDQSKDESYFKTYMAKINNNHPI